MEGGNIAYLSKLRGIGRDLTRVLTVTEFEDLNAKRTLLIGSSIATVIYII